MKIVSLCMVALSFALTACASVPAGPVASAYDVEYMARVERMARTSGVTVIWVNPPLRKSEPLAAAGR